MEERLPYKQEASGSIPPFPNDIIISVKNNYISKQKIREVTKQWEISDQNK